MPADIIQVVTTTAEKESAEKIGMKLLERRLAACVQVSGPVESSYWWNGRIETAREYLCTIKTLRDRFAAVEKIIIELHPYDQPEIMATAVVDVSADYRSWLLEQLRQPKKVAPLKEAE